ncbi:MAG: tetratricopeptide repeat protein [Desulfuromonadales bacterium]|nr:tetratricopeptide repeat protein [Desulfuromonadales bacterium]
MKTFLSAAFLLITLALPWSAQAQQESLLSFADSLAAEGDHYRAITEYKRFLHNYPQSPDSNRARLSIARSLIAGKRWLQADLALEALIETSPDSSEATAARRDYADIAFERSDYRLARERYLALAETSEDRATLEHAHYRIGWTLLEENQPEQARLSFARLAPQRAEQLVAALDDYQQLPHKSPLLAGFLSALLPGAGQAYTGRYKQAALAFCLNAAFIYGSIEAVENDNYTVGGILLFFESGWYTGNIYNAVNNAHKFNQRQQAKHKGEMRQRFGLQLGWQEDRPLLLARLRF